MNELMLLLMILTALALSAILADLEMWLEERKKKNVNTTRYVRFRSGVRSSNVRKEIGQRLKECTNVTLSTSTNTNTQ